MGKKTQTGQKTVRSQRADRILQDALNGKTEELAAGIMRNADELDAETVSDSEDDANMANSLPPVNDSGAIPGSEDIVRSSARPGPVEIPFGQSKEDARKVKNMNEIDQILKSLFGSQNGDYFILSEYNYTMHKVNTPVDRRMKCLHLEDKNRYGYYIWFEMSGMLSY